MKLTWFNSASLTATCLMLSLSAGGCLAYVEHDGEDEGGAYASSAQEPSVDGIPCSHLRGEVTLNDYDGENMSSASFSFQFATQDAAITNNDYDVHYEGNLFRVNLVTDDLSYIVDLGDVALASVPETVALSDYELGNWGEHDNIGAIVNHTYFVRNRDGGGRTVAAFRVTGLEPGVRTTLSWIRSLDPDLMVVPTACGL